MKSPLRILLLAMLPCFVFLHALGQKDTSFWFAPPEICQAQGIFNMDLDTPIYVRLSTYGQPSTVTISQPANAAFVPIIRNMGANSVVTVELTPFKLELETMPVDHVLNTGLKISATTPISAYYDAESTDSPEIFTLKGQNALGTSFWIPGQNVVENAYYPPTPYNSIDIVATEDNTVVTINPAQPVTGHPAGVPYSVTLNKGQTYSAGATSSAPGAHLQGSTVTATLPIAIDVKDDLLDASSIWGNGQDLTGDEIVPVNIIGTEYIPVRGDLNSPYDKIFILGTQNNTTVNQDGAYLTTINAGVTYSFYMNNPSTFIQTSSPVYVWQLSGQGGELGAGILPPVNCTGSYQVAYVRATADPVNIMVLVENGGQNNFLFNGSASVITPAGFAPVPGTGGNWLAGKFSISLAQLPADSPALITNSTNLFHMGVDNGTVGAGASFGYFSNFDSFTVVAHNTVTPCNLALQLQTDSIPNAVYSWTGPNGFSSTAVNPVIPNPTLQDSGNYTLTVRYNACNAVAITHVTIDTAGATSTFNLGNDTAYCGPFSRVLSTGFAGTGWSTGATGAQITITTAGTYWATDSGACGRFADTIVISQSTQPPAFNLGNDTTYCGSFSTVLSSGIDSTLWSTGATGRQITINTPGTYWASATTACGNASDTIVINQSAVPPVILGGDSLICTGQTIVLNATSNNAAYHWQDNSTLPTYSTSAAGTYSVTVTNIAGCSVNESVNVIASSPIQIDLGGSIKVCGNEGAILNIPVANAHFVWSDGSTDSVDHVYASGNYTVTVSNGCTSATGEVSVSVYPDDCRILVPTAFSPNGDGVNDVFHGICRCPVSNYSMSVYNRWGEEVFSTTNIQSGWDGTYKNLDQPVAVYVYYINYMNYCEGKIEQIKGNVTLVR